MDQDLWMRALFHHGPLLLQTILSDVPDIESENTSENVRICKFIKNKMNLLFKSVNTNDAKLKTANKFIKSAIPTLPIELFQNVSELDRRELFFGTLDRGSILLLRVINDSLPDNYKLLVLAKHEGCMKLDDLSLLMYLPKLEPEMILAGGELHSDDLIRAAVCSCSINERKLYVTLDSNILDDECEQVPPLGKISVDDLPHYIRKSNLGSSYTEYLRQTHAFNDTEWEKELYSVLNLKENYIYSFYENWDGKTYPQSEYGSELKKKQDLLLSNIHYGKALEYYEKENHTEAILYLNKALSICSENVAALISRGNLYAKTNNLTKAVLDMDAALKIDPSNESAKEQMSVLLVSLAKVHINDMDFDRAQECLNFALTLNTENTEAAAALQSIHAKLPTALQKKSPAMKISSDSSSSKMDSKNSFDASSPSTSQSLSMRMKKRRHHSKTRRRHHHRHRRHHRRSRSPKRK